MPVSLRALGRGRAAGVEGQGAVGLEFEIAEVATGLVESAAGGGPRDQFVQVGPGGIRRLGVEGIRGRVLDRSLERGGEVALFADDRREGVVAGGRDDDAGGGVAGTGRLAAAEGGGVEADDVDPAGGVALDELAQFCLYLVSDLAGSITGSSLPIDGGWTAR